MKKFNDNEKGSGYGAKVQPEGSKLTEENIKVLEDDHILFKDFTEPDLLKTGYLIPL